MQGLQLVPVLFGGIVGFPRLSHEFFIFFPFCFFIFLINFGFAIVLLAASLGYWPLIRMRAAGRCPIRSRDQNAVPYPYFTAQESAAPGASSSPRQALARARQIRAAFQRLARGEGYCRRGQGADEERARCCRCLETILPCKSFFSPVQIISGMCKKEANRNSRLFDHRSDATLCQSTKLFEILL